MVHLVYLGNSPGCTYPCLGWTCPWSRRLVGKSCLRGGGLEDTDVAQNRLNRDVIVLGSGSNQNTFLVSDAQPCPWRSLQICLIFSNGGWNVHVDLKKLVVWSHWMIGKPDSYCFNEFLIQLWYILLHVLSYIHPTFTMNKKTRSNHPFASFRGWRGLWATGDHTRRSLPLPLGWCGAPCKSTGRTNALGATAGASGKDFDAVCLGWNEGWEAWLEFEKEFWASTWALIFVSG